jgi:hypothetical protein
MIRDFLFLTSKTGGIVHPNCLPRLCNTSSYVQEISSLALLSKELAYTKVTPPGKPTVSDSEHKASYPGGITGGHARSLLRAVSLRTWVEVLRAKSACGPKEFGFRTIKRVARACPC